MSNRYVQEHLPIRLVDSITLQSHAGCGHRSTDFDTPETFKRELSLKQI